VSQVLFNLSTFVSLAYVKKKVKKLITPETKYEIGKFGLDASNGT